MHPIAYVVMLFGATLAVVGILLFTRMGAAGTSAVKMFGLEFQLGGSALVIFVVGIVLFMMPFIRRADFPNPPESTDSHGDHTTAAQSSAAVPDSSAATNYWLAKGVALWKGNGDEYYSQPDSALAYYSRAISMSPRGDNPLLGRAQVYIQFGMLGDALRDLDRAITINPSNGQLYNWRGIVYLKTNNRNNACAEFLRGSQLGFAQAGVNATRFC